MKKSELVKLIREMVAQHPVHQKINDKLLQIAKRGADAEERERYVGDPKKGNKVLDKANPENVAKILKGEKPIYEEASNEVSIMLDDLTVDKIKEVFPNFGEKYGQLSFPNPNDSLTQINSQESLERWKDGTREEYGNVEVVLYPEETVWFNKVKINDPEFIADKETSTKRKASWLDSEREAGRTGGLD